MDETKPTQTSSSNSISNSKEGLGTGAKIGIGAAVVVGLVILALVLFFLLNNPETTATVRDLFIIILAFESLIIGTLLVILIYQLITLIQMFRDELRPMIQSTQETLNTVKGTATFVGQRVTKPAIAASGYAAGVTRSLRVLAALLPKRRRSTLAASSISDESPDTDS